MHSPLYETIKKVFGNILLLCVNIYNYIYCVYHLRQSYLLTGHKKKRDMAGRLTESWSLLSLSATEQTLIVQDKYTYQEDQRRVSSGRVDECLASKTELCEGRVVHIRTLIIFDAMMLLIMCSL
ncbi:hypothetical protein ASPZODRAFT_1973270 [Penicilliopsis zonata CBS 506.65]|uniref:Uncharacterized protein n=1 Tax=Penicilliopsis zonata CBS 506.65 TaxID=1073090 RepID=A0A1L9SH92_9EURO|nr:hypothetical protein ASPZODRAFT_1973270 [Penicilliopsis zonata CBS 506.65]OJJ46569.1 hypothetical protein ASPZODRAFT_1973270 [Penicilliopsis zonata CBS 506.65]